LLQGVQKFPRVLTVAATNLPNKLDNAILRRLSLRVFVDLPNFNTRAGLVKNAFFRALAGNVAPNAEQVKRWDNFFRGVLPRTNCGSGPGPRSSVATTTTGTTGTIGTTVSTSTTETSSSSSSSSSSSIPGFSNLDPFNYQATVPQMSILTTLPTSTISTTSTTSTTSTSAPLPEFGPLFDVLHQLVFITGAATCEAGADREEAVLKPENILNPSLQSDIGWTHAGVQNIMNQIFADMVQTILQDEKKPPNTRQFQVTDFIVDNKTSPRLENSIRNLRMQNPLDAISYELSKKFL